jgi:putative Ca2+/H+ antiporter (TMEM165/GDT1 family)
MLYLWLAAYGTVLSAELLGDKSVYTICSLAARFRYAHVLGGVGLAYAGKMLVAVLIGQSIASLPPAFIAGTSAVTFFATALFVWFRNPAPERAEGEEAQRWPRAAALSFAAIFFTEWGDVGQIAAATLAARYQAPLIVWLGATAALLTKALLALTLGVKLRARIPPRPLRYVACAMCLLMGVLSILKID